MRLSILLSLSAIFLATACGGGGPCSAPPDLTKQTPDSAREKFQKLSDLCVVDPPTTPGSGKLVVKSGTVPYDLTTPLFSDYALKFRTMWIPPGTKITYSADGIFDLPVGSIVTKTFSFAADERVPDKDVRILETRVLLHTGGGWVALPYVWNAEQTDAKLDPLGSFYTTPFIDKNGVHQTPNYLIPSRTQCLLCHEGVDPTAPIGIKARVLNKDYAYDTGTMNQIEHLVSLGMLEGAPASAKDAPRIPAFDDPNDGTVEQRARAWLETNCAHCHSAKGGARTTGFFLDWAQTDPFTIGICKPPVAAGSGTGGRKYDIIPGQPDASIVPFRIESNEPATMMPPVGRSIVHTEGVAVVKQWIQSLNGTCN